MAAIEKTFYGNSSAQKVKSKAISGSSAVTVLNNAGLLWGFSSDSEAVGKITDNITNIAFVNKNSIWFNQPVAFDTSLKITLSTGKAVVYYE
jgi:hypothetical protein